MTDTLSANKDRQLRALKSRQGRKKSDLFVCEGVRACREAISRKRPWIQWIVCSESFVQALVPGSAHAELLESAAAEPVIPVYCIAERQFAAYAQTEHTQGMIVVLERPDTTVRPVVSDPFVLALDQLGDPGNLGSILRSAWALGLQQVALTAGSTDPFGAKAVRAGMGAQFAVDLVMFDDLQALWSHYCAHGYRRLWVSAADAAVSCFEDRFEPERSVLVLGNESHGASRLDDAESIRIPMPGDAESLNVAMAGSVLLFEARRRLGGPGFESMPGR